MVHGQETFLAPIISKACISVLPEQKEKFDVDNVRVAKILGGSLMDTDVIKGLVVVRTVEGNITKVQNCKVAVYNCPLETQGAETSDEVIFKSANDQYGIDKFGEAFEVVPRTLLDNSGFNVHETLSTLRAKSLTDGKMGINVKNGEIKNAFDMGVYDSLSVKTWGIKLAVEAVFTVLRIDQVIVAKPAGGPNLGKKPPGANEADEF